MLLTLFGITGCSTSKIYPPLAPAPPEMRFTSLYYEQQTAENIYYLSEKPQDKIRKSPQELLKEAFVSKTIGPPNPFYQDADKKGFSTEGGGDKKCSLRHRFDRNAVLAYEWGRNRLALDVDGLNLRPSEGDMGFKIQYHLRLQPEKTWKERCRYDSHWQGLIGSTYNEFFVRETDTVWDEMKEMKKDVNKFIDGHF